VEVDNDGLFTVSMYIVYIIFAAVIVTLLP
jgi:hypothetical protein